MTLETIIPYIYWLGPWFFFLGALTEALPVVGTFLPGATIVTLGGFASAHGYFYLPVVLVLSITGSILGDAIGYYTGIYGGNLIRRKKVISEILLQKGELFFNKYGNQSLLWGRFIGPLRSVMPFLVGVSKVKPEVFWFWNIISGTIWGTVYVLFGYFSGNLLTIIINHWDYKLTWLIVIIVLVLIIWLLIRRRIEKIFISKS
jgi:Uncharacterized membrane-associated protein